MPISETQKDLLSYLDYQTREFDPSKLEHFTTIDIARAMAISRNLCSQYLNDLVRRGFVVKAGTRPIYYFHKHNLERYLQARISEQSYDVVEELLALKGSRPDVGFERAIGYIGSLSGVIAKMRVAIGYPPCGLPVMILGATGTGKTYMVELMLAYAKNSGFLNEDAQIIPIDCSQYQAYPGNIIREYEGTPDNPGWREIAKGGLLYYKNVDLLTAGEQEYLFTQALFAARAEQGSKTRGLRFVFTSTIPLDSEDALRYTHRLPVVVELPPLHLRTDRERKDLALHFMRDEGRRMGVDVFVTEEALKCLTTAAFDDNISELRRSITNACAEAHLMRKGTNRIEIHAYNLQSNVLRAVELHNIEGTGTLIDVTRLQSATVQESAAELFAGVVAPYQMFEEGKGSEQKMLGNVAFAMGHLEDRLIESLSQRQLRLEAFERLIAQIVEEASATFSVEISHNTAHLLAQLMHEQIWPDGATPRWKLENNALIERMSGLIAKKYIAADHIAEHIAQRLAGSLDLQLDVASQLFLLCHLALIEHLD